MQYPRSTLKKGSKVKSNHTNTFPAHDFLKVAITHLAIETDTQLTHHIVAMKKVAE